MGHFNNHRARQANTGLQIFCDETSTGNMRDHACWAKCRKKLHGENPIRCDSNKSQKIEQDHTNMRRSPGKCEYLGTSSFGMVAKLSAPGVIAVLRIDNVSRLPRQFRTASCRPSN